MLVACPLPACHAKSSGFVLQLRLVFLAVALFGILRLFFYFRKEKSHGFPSLHCSFIDGVVFPMLLPDFTSDGFFTGHVTGLVCDSENSDEKFSFSANER